MVASVVLSCLGGLLIGVSVIYFFRGRAKAESELQRTNLQLFIGSALAAAVAWSGAGITYNQWAAFLHAPVEWQQLRLACLQGGGSLEGSGELATCRQMTWEERKELACLQGGGDFVPHNTGGRCVPRPRADMGAHP